MQYIQIEPTYKTPKVVLDPEKGEVHISGRSILVEVDEFYQQLLDWIDTFLIKSHPRKVTFEFDLEYFNVTSFKRILFIFYRFMENEKFKNLIEVKWFYQASDADMLEMGQDFGMMINMPVELIGYEKLKQQAKTIN
jgi:hypothetical protein